MTRPRILLFSSLDPDGSPSGGTIRLRHTIAGLARVGDVDYLQWRARGWRRRGRTPSTDGLPLASYRVMERRGVPDRLGPAYESIRRRLGMDRRMPYLVATAPVPRRLPDVAHYDLIWCWQIAGARVLRRSAGDVPMVVDLVDLPKDPVWRRASEEVAQWATRTVLANPDEAAQLGVELVESGCELRARRELAPVGACPRFVFVGWMHYPPNEEAAQWLVRAIVPELHRRLDRFEVRIVGRAPASVRGLAGDDVTVTGYVDDLDSELGAADVAIVPLLDGAGTRLKILEAFSHQVPVVSTTVGAEGIAAADGDALLLADDPAGFAEACARVLREDALRHRLVERAYELARGRYDWTIIEGRIAQLARDVIDETSRPSSARRETAS